MTILPTLYKMNANQSIQQWKIFLDKSKQRYITEYGLMNGKQQQTISSIAAPKNIGKANATSIETQAIQEMKSIWTAQKERHGYTEYIPVAKPLRPMLAKSHDKDGHHIKYPCFVQAKYDGVRCLAMKKKGKVTLWSRLQKQFTVLNHLEKELAGLLSEGEIWDGELYSTELSFQEIIGAVKRIKPNKNTEKIEYWVYDLVSANDFVDRISHLYEKLFNYLGSIKLVATDTLIDVQHIQTELQFAIHNGFEGIILRNARGGYEINKRSKNLQKVKNFREQEFEIVNARSGKNRFEGFCIFTCKTENGAEFDVLPEGDEAHRKQLLESFKNGTIKAGNKLTVKFFEWTTPDNPNMAVPRFPIGKAVRTYEG